MPCERDEASFFLCKNGSQLYPIWKSLGDEKNYVFQL